MATGSGSSLKPGLCPPTHATFMKQSPEKVYARAHQGPCQPSMAPEDEQVETKQMMAVWLLVISTKSPWNLSLGRVVSYQTQVSIKSNFLNSMRGQGT